MSGFDMNTDQVAAVFCVIAIGDFLLIPINILISTGGKKDDRLKGLLVVAYSLAILTCMAAAHFNNSGIIFLSMICAASVWPLSLWRLFTISRDRPRG